MQLNNLFFTAVDKHYIWVSLLFVLTRKYGLLIRVMVSNTTFNNITVLLVEEPEYLEKTTELPQVTDKLDYIMLY